MTVSSPCVDVCKTDRKTGICIGCFRTVEEIRQWRKLTDHKRRRILAELPQRKAKLVQHDR